MGDVEHLMLVVARRLVNLGKLVGLQLDDGVGWAVIETQPRAQPSVEAFLERAHFVAPHVEAPSDLLQGSVDGKRKVDEDEEKGKGDDEKGAEEDAVPDASLVVQVVEYVHPRQQEEVGGDEQGGEEDEGRAEQPEEHYVHSIFVQWNFIHRIGRLIRVLLLESCAYSSFSLIVVVSSRSSVAR